MNGRKGFGDYHDKFSILFNSVYFFIIDFLAAVDQQLMLAADTSSRFTTQNLLNFPPCCNILLFFL